ncbi:hypothetical protein FKZ61_007720 [Litorilinea aerophila]|uniref:Uncharacterized protein n=1 Tax=Litorilinea aerophila TaxID=1204385 RepID=A0A540VI43_9CHLR|nr:hypothetical protein [Litorilinea aerophila]MCC9075997.1 hypothetical protein [Litorilinea aerophila]OUC09292.1 hypothetical protein RY27_03720 [Litorilinea aerophila]GIV80276.1 MAG: hypothetical protein KatS3mg050_4670 [Litorilinea sp.]GIV80409.1 MAG: hypothetical protein KatS3mg050_4803 [Litorilinea sp.]
MNGLKQWLHRFTSSETMAILLVIWLCSLVAIGLIVTPLFGARVAGATAVSLLVALLLLCWGLCLTGYSHWHR